MWWLGLRSQSSAGSEIACVTICFHRDVRLLDLSKLWIVGIGMYETLWSCIVALTLSFWRSCMFPKQPEELFVVILAIYETWPQEPKVGVSALQTSSEEIGHKTDHSVNHFSGESSILRMLSFCFNADRPQSSVECCVTRTDQELQAHQPWLLCMHWRPCLLLVSGGIDGFLWA